ncbi:MAG: CcmD family protein [Terriglobales bacterium]|jgi:CcmD family protein
MTYLFAAYVATWVIHITYLGHLARGYARLKREIEELRGKKP